MRVAIYVRVSTKEQDTSLQLSGLTEYCEARGFSHFEIFEEKKSATNLQRPIFQAMLADVYRRKFDLVLVWKLDRAFRSLKDLVNTLAEFDSLNVKFVALKDNLDLSTPAGKMISHIIGAFAEFEASLIRERVRAGLAQAKKDGVRLGRPESRHPDTKKVMELMSRGMGPTKIADLLKISRATVYRIKKAA